MKIYKLILGCAFVSVAFCACSNTTATEEVAAEASEVSAVEPSYAFFGEKISPESTVTLDEVYRQIENESADSLLVKVKGTVEEVCQAKGCWMNIVDAEDTLEPMMVRFKDYGFFVPKDIAGKEVILEGVAYREKTPVDELRHYAEDAGKSKEEIEAITEPKDSYRFLASGVILVEAGE